MTPTVSESKTALRNAVRAALKSMSPTQRTAASQAICDGILRSEPWQHSVSVMLFSPLPDEPDIWPLAAQAHSTSKQVLLPRYSSRTQQYQAAMVHDLQADLVEGNYGILEPSPHCPVMPLNQLDLVLVPGVAFAPCGHRLGRGRGYYDRILQQVRGMRVGVAFNQQVMGTLPIDPHDEKLNVIVTPTRWLPVSGEGAH